MLMLNFFFSPSDHQTITNPESRIQVQTMDTKHHYPFNNTVAEFTNSRIRKFTNLRIYEITHLYTIGYLIIVSILFRFIKFSNFSLRFLHFGFIDDLFTIIDNAMFLIFIQSIALKKFIQFNNTKVYLKRMINILLFL